MPGISDLELQADIDLKQYMDPSILLDNFSPVDMDMWHGYNNFLTSDEHIASNSATSNANTTGSSTTTTTTTSATIVSSGTQVSAVSDSSSSSNNSHEEHHHHGVDVTDNDMDDGHIKEENIDLMDYCFSSICPNDLLNMGKEEFNSCSSSSSSSSSSASSSSAHSTSSSPSCSDLDLSKANPFDLFDDRFQLSGALNNNSESYDCHNGVHVNMNQHQQQLHDEHQLHQGYLYESASSTPGYSSPSSTPPQSLNIDPSAMIDIKPTLVSVMNASPVYHIKPVNQPIILVEPPHHHHNHQLSTTKACTKSNTIRQLTTNSTSAPVANNKTTGVPVLPPSPPSSFGSDSESNHSSSSAATTPAASTTTTTTTVVLCSKQSGTKGLSGTKSAKLNVNRHQPYSLKANVNIKTSVTKLSKLNSANSAGNGNSASDVNALSTSQSSLANTSMDDDCWPFLCSLSKLPTSGPLLLTEEEKRTLIQEGHQVPSQLPLTKSEEKILKKIRRKIKNKISAQESRRKKKEYVDSLEKRMENFINENYELKKRLEDLEINNKTLINQLKKMQTNSSNGSSSSLSLSNVANYPTIDSEAGCGQSSSQFFTLLMVLVLFFAVLLGIWSPVTLNKEQLGHSAVAAAAVAATAQVAAAQRSPANSLVGTASSTSAAVAVAAAAVSFAATSGFIKTETNDVDAQQQQQQQPGLNDAQTKTVCELDKSQTQFKQDDEFVPVYDPPNPSTTAIIARSKTGTAVELTKVRPFIRKLQQQQQDSSLCANFKKAKTNGNNLKLPVGCDAVGEPSLNSSNNQIIILNLNQSAAAPSSSPSTILNNELSNGTTAKTLANHYKLINNHPTKLTKFRVINNNNNPNNSISTPTGVPNAPSAAVIKLN